MTLRLESGAAYEGERAYVLRDERYLKPSVPLKEGAQVYRVVTEIPPPKNYPYPRTESRAFRSESHARRWLALIAQHEDVRQVIRVKRRDLMVGLNNRYYIWTVDTSVDPPERKVVLQVGEELYESHYLSHLANRQAHAIVHPHIEIETSEDII